MHDIEQLIRTCHIESNLISESNDDQAIYDIKRIMQTRIKCED
jgi:hypothetical protein